MVDNSKTDINLTRTEGLQNNTLVIWGGVLENIPIIKYNFVTKGQIIKVKTINNIEVKALVLRCSKGYADVQIGSKHYFINSNFKVLNQINIHTMEIIKLLSIAVAIFTVYVGFIWLKFGIQKSISASYYKLKGWRQIIFTLVLWAFSLLIMMANDNGLIFFAGCAICFVGASPAINSSMMAKKVHYIGATTGIIFALLALIISFGQWLLVLNLFYIAIIMICKLKNWMWWVEILMFYGIIGGLML